MKRIVTIVGARPQFIKASAVIRAFRAARGIEHVLVHTGQHYDPTLSDVFFDELEIPAPDYHLGIGSGTHGQQTGRMIEEIEKVLFPIKPDWVVVYGDTNSTLAGALAAVKLHLRIAHVEAGLRSFNRRMPEEINRIVTDTVSDLLFAPTKTAVDNLRNEGIPGARIHRVGDVMLDVALYCAEKAKRKSAILKRLNLAPEGYILCTIHRAENTEDPKRLKAICDGLCLVSRELPVVLPLHPRTKKALEASHLLPKVRPMLILSEAIGYLDMVLLEQHARLIATDSGGVQKEAFFYKVPCVTLRDETEWVELVELGWNRTVSPCSGKEVAKGILQAVHTRGAHAYPYGKGRASQKIVSILVGSR
jgi:UDP-GlcNAc3NAcA epimerase